MEAFYGLTLAGSLGWFLGFSGGSLRKCIGYHRTQRDAECRANLDRAVQRRTGPAFSLAQYRAARAERIAFYGDARPGAVPRDHDGSGPGGLSAGRVAHIADAAALT